MRTRALLVLVAAGAIGLAACGGDNSSSTSATTAAPAAATATTAAPAAATTTATTADADSSSYGAPSSTTAPASAAAAATTVTLATTPLGMILADAKGNTLYIFTKDTPGTSNCAGACIKNWPAATVTGTPTAASGISASALGTITGTDGSTQLTINNQPLYTFAADKAPGDTNGQGYQSIWWVVGPDGTAIKS
jgi:predicted lipoprotein with Yx(FWY)xxD motif